MYPTELLQQARRNAAEFIAIRHDIHQHPELAFHEQRTGNLVAERLEKLGYRVERGIGGTGLVGQMRLGDGARTIGIRADMDALPIHESTGLAYASRHAGVMHACGHDGHTAMLLGAAQLLAERARFSGTVNLIFQPAEEYGRSDSGAARMIGDGLFRKYPCDAIFGMHNSPGNPQGHFVLRDGPMMASSDKVAISIHGLGGHGASPHRACDPIVVIANLVTALQSIVSRNVDPQEAAVVTVGLIHAGTANNVIPPIARIELTVRALNAEVRTLLEKRIIELTHSIARGYGASAEIDYQHGYPPLVNTAAETEFARDVAVELAGREHVTPRGPALTGSEDFAFMLEQCPGAYLLIGNGAERGPTSCMIHNPGFDFNDDNVSIGAAYWTLLTERFLVDDSTTPTLRNSL
ncbi:M20 aminoacylase family protein [Burkholderia contaminans]|uniref:M20 aminoacylase family protein n=1 Tax=Burkholderia contaminans TaxID=488447 RepID=UPI000F5628BD|nr:M20 aminoacylase family protein [Burkholderia contaminans]RQS88761.1 amidohydrolase [Burkholderia contaminans]